MAVYFKQKIQKLILKTKSFHRTDHPTYKNVAFAFPEKGDIEKPFFVIFHLLCTDFVRCCFTMPGHFSHKCR